MRGKEGAREREGIVQDVLAAGVSDWKPPPSGEQNISLTSRLAHIEN